MIEQSECNVIIFHATTHLPLWNLFRHIKTIWVTWRPIF